MEGLRKHSENDSGGRERPWIKIFEVSEKGRAMARPGGKSRLNENRSRTDWKERAKQPTQPGTKRQNRTTRKRGYRKAHGRVCTKGQLISNITKKRCMGCHQRLSLLTSRIFKEEPRDEHRDNGKSPLVERRGRGLDSVRSKGQ